MNDQNEGEIKVEPAQILFAKTRNATPAQIQQALSSIGRAIVTIKYGRGPTRTHFGASFICMENQKQQQQVLEEGFKIDFSKEQLDEQNEDIKKAIERTRKEFKAKGQNPTWVKDFDPDREISTTVFADIAKFTPPREGDKDCTLYISDIVTKRSKGEIEQQLTAILDQIGGLEKLTIHQKRSNDAWEDEGDEENKAGKAQIYFAFAEFAHTEDAQSAYLMIKDHEYENKSFLSCSYANSRPRGRQSTSPSYVRGQSQAVSPSSGTKSPTSPPQAASPASGKKSPTSPPQMKGSPGAVNPASGKSPSNGKGQSWRK